MARAISSLLPSKSTVSFVSSGSSQMNRSSGLVYTRQVCRWSGSYRTYTFLSAYSHRNSGVKYSNRTPLTVTCTPRCPTVCGRVERSIISARSSLDAGFTSSLPIRRWNTSIRFSSRSSAMGPLYRRILKYPLMSVSTASTNSSSVGTCPCFSTFFRHSGFSVGLPPVNVSQSVLNWPFISRNFRSMGFAWALRTFAHTSWMPSLLKMGGGSTGAPGFGFLALCPSPPTSRVRNSRPLSLRIFRGMPCRSMPRRSANSVAWAQGLSVTYQPV